MARISLPMTVIDHGSMPITVEEFAAITGISPAVFRGRRERDPGFPSPINTDAVPLTYFLRDLANWGAKTRLVRSRSIDDVALARWRFSAALERCSAEHGADATRSLVAGAALLCDDWPLSSRTEQSDLLRQLRNHIAAVEPRYPKVQTTTDDFMPDPSPATDRSFLTSLVSWSSPPRNSRSPRGVISPQIPDRSEVAGRLLADLLVLHRETTRRLVMGGANRTELWNSEFVDVIDAVARGLARDTLTRPSNSDLGLTRLMVGILDPRPGETVVDLACGQGSTFIEAIRSTQPPGRSNQLVGCIGREEDERVWTIAKIRLGLRGIAHDLGRPEDGLTCEMDPRASHRFVTDPAMRIPQLHRWIQRHLDLLDPNAIAILAVPAASVFRSNPGRWWIEVQKHLDGVVFTPTDTAVILLRNEAPSWKLLVQIHRMTPAMAERRYRELHSDSLGSEQEIDIPLDVVDPAIEPFMPAQIRRVVEQLGGGAPSRSTDRKPSEGDEDFVQWRPLAEFTLEALGEPRFGDCTAIRDAVPPPEHVDSQFEPSIMKAIAAQENEGATAPEPSTIVRRHLSREDSPRRPMRERGSFAALREGSDESRALRQLQDIERRALGAVSFLRWVLDPSTADEKAGGDPGSRPGIANARINGALEELATEETRRALRRLEQRLRGEETRGRRARPESENS